MFEYADVQLRLFLFVLFFSPKRIHMTSEHLYSSKVFGYFYVVVFLYGEKSHVNILQNIIFCVPHEKISHNDLEQLKKVIIQQFILIYFFFGELSL